MRNTFSLAKHSFSPTANRNSSEAIHGNVEILFHHCSFWDSFLETVALDSQKDYKKQIQIAAAKLPAFYDTVLQYLKLVWSEREQRKVERRSEIMRLGCVLRMVENGLNLCDEYYDALMKRLMFSDSWDGRFENWLYCQLKDVFPLTERTSIKNMLKETGRSQQRDATYASRKCTGPEVKLRIMNCEHWPGMRGIPQIGLCQEVESIVDDYAKKTEDQCSVPWDVHPILGIAKIKISFYTDRLDSERGNCKRVKRVREFRPASSAFYYGNTLTLR